MRVYGGDILFKTNIYFGCFNGTLYKIDITKEKIKQIFQTYGSKANYNLVYNDKNEFKTGFELYGNDLNESENKILDLGALLSTPIIENDIMYFSDSYGTIYAYKL